MLHRTVFLSAKDVTAHSTLTSISDIDPKDGWFTLIKMFGFSARDVWPVIQDFSPRAIGPGCWPIKQHPWGPSIL